MAASITIRDYLRRRAAWVWNEQGHAFDHGLVLQEETLTEMLLSRMARDNTVPKLNVTMFNKTEEGINGADWEWIVRTPWCDVGLRVQAKRLYHSNTKKEYGGLDPASGQTAKLIANAGSSIPIYVFYNHSSGKSSAILKGGGEKPYRGRSYWGCSIATAQEVQAAKSNKLADLKSSMKPWHRLFTATGACDVTAALGIGRPALDASMPPERRDVLDRIQNRDFMSEYIVKHNLSGVAILDFSSFRGD